MDTIKIRRPNMSIHLKSNLFLALITSGLLIACSEQDQSVAIVTPVIETVPVSSTDDAADDPAIWVHPTDPEKSLVLGTDKRAGLYIYQLDGSIQGFLPSGRLNNVDLRQGVTVDNFTGDIAAATNRTDDSVTLFSVSADKTEEWGRFPSLEAEPYGLCTGMFQGAYTIFVTYKTGTVIAHRLDSANNAPEIARYKFESQLEGCVFDDKQQVLYVGEENKGIWRLNTVANKFSPAHLIDEVGSKTGIIADVEGLALYETSDGKGYLVASSQGNNSYAVYNRSETNAFITRFRIGDYTAPDGNLVDATQETDGLAVSSAAMGGAFSNGLLVVQDGQNLPSGSTQNFKFIDWRMIQSIIEGVSQE
jgi:3-phytase